MPAYSHQTILTLLIAVSCICSAILAQPQQHEHDLQGNYTIARLVNASHQSVDLYGEEYMFQLEFDRNKNKSNSVLYTFDITVGNFIGGSMVLKEEANNATGTVKDTMSWSTRMYPGPRLYAIELALLDVLDQADRFARKNNNTLVFYAAGSDGLLVLKRNCRLCNSQVRTTSRRRKRSQVKTSSLGCGPVKKGMMMNLRC